MSYQPISTTEKHWLDLMPQQYLSGCSNTTTTPPKTFETMTIRIYVHHGDTVLINRGNSLADFPFDIPTWSGSNSQFSIRDLVLDQLSVISPRQMMLGLQFMEYSTLEHTQTEFPNEKDLQICVLLMADSKYPDTRGQMYREWRPVNELPNLNAINLKQAPFACPPGKKYLVDMSAQLNTRCNKAAVLAQYGANRDLLKLICANVIGAMATAKRSSEGATLKLWGFIVDVDSEKLLLPRTMNEFANGDIGPYRRICGRWRENCVVSLEGDVDEWAGLLRADGTLRVSWI